MKPVVTACNAQHIHSFLDGNLDQSQESALTDHVEVCETCRDQLESLAAEPQSWQEAHTFLQPTKVRFCDSSRSVEEESTGKETGQTPIQIRSVLNSLAPTDDPNMIGRLGSYEVSGVVGMGGMGIVLKAFDRSLDRTVAIKVLAPHLASSGAARHRFAREAKAAAAVLHPNVIAIHGVDNNDALPWLVMPYIKGTSLRKRIDQQGPLPVSEVLRIGAQIAAGLAAAHAQGLVHRDIKPANVLLEEGVERVTITDFGLARAIDDATMTRSGIIAGTPQYMSPEQARGEPVDGRSDLFSLGSLLYSMCTGHSPFRAETTYGVMRRITDEPARAVREVNPDVPDWLSLVIDKLMSKDPEQRFQSSATVAELLEESLAHVQQPTSSPLPIECTELIRRSNPRHQKHRPPKSKRTIAGSGIRRSVTFAVAAGLFAILGAMGAMWWYSGDPPEISGTWDGADWGTVTLTESRPGQYTGSYSDVHGNEPGEINLKWSRLEKRFNGKWRDSKLRFGKISIRMIEDELRGAWTTSKKSEVDSGTPRLSDLAWTRTSSKTVEPNMASSVTKPEISHFLLRFNLSDVPRLIEGAKWVSIYGFESGEIDFEKTPSPIMVNLRGHVIAVNDKGFAEFAIELNTRQAQDLINRHKKYGKLYVFPSSYKRFGRTPHARQLVFAELQLPNKPISKDKLEFSKKNSLPVGMKLFTLRFHRGFGLSQPVEGSVVSIYGVNPHKTKADTLVATLLMEDVLVQEIIQSKGDRATAVLMIENERANELLEKQTNYEQIQLLAERPNSSDDYIKAIPFGKKVVAVRISATDIEGSESIEPGDEVYAYFFDESATKNDRLTRYFNLLAPEPLTVYSVTRDGDQLVVGLLVSEEQSDFLPLAVEHRIELSTSKLSGDASGSITHIQRDKIAINLGIDDGIQMGDRIAVKRDDASIAYARIFAIESNRSAAQIERSEGDKRPKVGDRILAPRFENTTESEPRTSAVDPNGHESTERTDNGRFDFDGNPKPVFEKGMWLFDAVERFNKHYADHPLATGQPPLTQDEVVAAMRWAAGQRATKLKGMADREFEEFQSIIENRRLPEYWGFEILTDFGTLQNEKTKAWTIRISVEKPNPDGKEFGLDPNDYTFGIRDQSLFQSDESGKPMPIAFPELNASQLDPNGMSLATAINAFNETHRSIDGIVMPELTLSEVLASIKRAHRSVMPLTNGEYAEFQNVAETGQLPEGYELTLLPGFQPGDGYRYKIFSVRLKFPRSSKTGWTYAHLIRNQFIKSEKVDSADIAWGPVAGNGLQIGVRFVDGRSRYSIGEIVTPEFFVRNTGDEKFDVTYPRIITHAYIDQLIVMDEDDQTVQVGNIGIGGPVGWATNSDFGFGSEINIRGWKTKLGGPRDPDDNESGLTHIMTESPGEYRLIYKLPNLADKDADELVTGEVSIEIRE